MPVLAPVVGRVPVGLQVHALRAPVVAWVSAKAPEAAAYMLARVVGQVHVRLQVRSLQMPAVALASAVAPEAVADSWPPH